MINSNFSVTEEDVLHFKKHGFVKLRNIFSPELIEHMQKLGTSQVSAPSDNYGAGFSRLKYDMCNDDPTILELMSDPAFARIMAQLIDHQVFFTQGLGFELEKNKSTGAPGTSAARASATSAARTWGTRSGRRCAASTPRTSAAA